MTPPRLRGLVDKLEKAVRMEYRTPKEQRAVRKQQTQEAKMNLLRAIAIIAQAPTTTTQRTQGGVK